MYYHLGLASFLLGNYEEAADAYRKGLACELCTIDMRVAFSDWLYMALRRMGSNDEAAEVLANAGDEKELIEDFAYQKRLQLYKGVIGPEDVLSSVRQPDSWAQRQRPASLARSLPNGRLYICILSNLFL